MAVNVNYKLIMSEIVKTHDKGSFLSQKNLLSYKNDSNQQLLSNSNVNTVEKIMRNKTDRTNNSRLNLSCNSELEENKNSSKKSSAIVRQNNIHKSTKRNSTIINSRLNLRKKKFLR
jgi:hypothetical protein